jgi:hypothetical protein
MLQHLDGSGGSSAFEIELSYKICRSPVLVPIPEPVRTTESGRRGGARPPKGLWPRRKLAAPRSTRARHGDWEVKGIASDF